MTEEKTDNSDSAEEKCRFSLPEFEGPLDLLLFLIKKNEVNIYDIPISVITEQYLSYIQFAQRINLENITDFYVMASTLLFIKSKMLLPVEVDLDDELEDPRRELVEKLIEYQKFKKLSELMKGREEEAEWSLERKKKLRILPMEDEGVWEKITVWDLLQTFSTVISSISSERVIDLYEEVTINEKISLIHELLDNKEEFYFSDLVTRPHSKMDIVCAFLAVLETAKARKIGIYQNKFFGDIVIRKRHQRKEDGFEEGSSDT